MGQVCENCGWRTKDGECIFTNPKTKRLWKNYGYRYIKTIPILLLSKIA